MLISFMLIKNSVLIYASRKTWDSIPFFIQKKKEKKGRYLFVNNKKKIYLLVAIISNDDIATVISY